MIMQQRQEDIRRFGINLKSARTCFYYSDKINAYIRIRLSNEEGRSEVEVSSTLNLPKLATIRSEEKYLLWHEDEELREIVNSNLFQILGDNISNYRKLILDGNGVLVK